MVVGDGSILGRVFYIGETTSVKVKGRRKQGFNHERSWNHLLVCELNPEGSGEHQKVSAGAKECRVRSGMIRFVLRRDHSGYCFKTYWRGQVYRPGQRSRQEEKVDKWAHFKDKEEVEQIGLCFQLVVKVREREELRMSPKSQGT